MNHSNEAQRSNSKCCWLMKQYAYTNSIFCHLTHSSWFKDVMLTVAHRFSSLKGLFLLLCILVFTVHNIKANDPCSDNYIKVNLFDPTIKLPLHNFPIIEKVKVLRPIPIQLRAVLPPHFLLLWRPMRVIDIDCWVGDGGVTSLFLSSEGGHRLSMRREAGPDNPPQIWKDFTPICLLFGSLLSSFSFLSVIPLCFHDGR